MKTNLFETFAKVTESFPVNGLLLMAELQEEMIENDLSQKRILPTEEAISVVNFCRFLKAVAHGSGIFPTTLPVQHLAFYRRTVKRLMDAGELPFNAGKQFSQTFLSILSENHWLFKFGNVGGHVEPQSEGIRIAA